MRWGITFLAWVASGIFLVNTCRPYLSVWQNPPANYPKERAFGHLQSCGERAAWRWAGATVVLVGLYFASGVLIERRRRDGGEA